MRQNMTRLSVAAILVAVCSATAAAQTCDEANFAATVEQMSATLRDLNGARQPDLRERMRDLARQRGWPEGEAESRTVALLQSADIRQLDAKAGALLVRIDELGDKGAAAGSCRDLDELKRTARELVETTKLKLDRLAARLDGLLSGAGTATASQAPTRDVAATTPAAPAPALPPRIQPSPPVPQRPAPNAPGLAVAAPWQTTVKPPAEVTAAIAALPPPIESPSVQTFSADEVQAAGRGLFGTLSADLASVIQFAFSSYGKPNGYILGQEGGAAFLAGLRYGNGMLVTKSAAASRVYWQGPSVGFDFGVAGSRVMMLVYNLDQPGQLEKRFAGADGAAFLVGGVGITFLKRGRLVIAPIRTGLGVRLGASVGYLKFSTSPSLNPL